MGDARKVQASGGATVEVREVNGKVVIEIQTMVAQGDIEMTTVWITPEQWRLLKQLGEVRCADSGLPVAGCDCELHA